MFIKQIRYVLDCFSFFLLFSGYFLKKSSCLILKKEIRNHSYAVIWRNNGERAECYYN